MGAGIHFFGIRHLSPAGAYYLREYLEEKKPKLVLIEGPSDLNDQIENMTRPETRPPIAILAYTRGTRAHYFVSDCRVFTRVSGHCLVP